MTLLFIINCYNIFIKIDKQNEFRYIIFHCYLYLDISKEKWDKMMASNKWNTVELRDNRYNQIVHMVSAANGAEDFYSTEVNE